MKRPQDLNLYQKLPDSADLASNYTGIEAHFLAHTIWLSYSIKECEKDGPLKTARCACD